LAKQRETEKRKKRIGQGSKLKGEKGAWKNQTAGQVKGPLARKGQNRRAGRLGKKEDPIRESQAKLTTEIKEEKGRAS